MVVIKCNRPGSLGNSYKLLKFFSQECYIWMVEEPFNLRWHSSWKEYNFKPKKRFENRRTVDGKPHSNQEKDLDSR